jgi:hypothetical protein
MGIRGVNYDAGTVTGPFHSRPVFDDGVTRRDLVVIRDELRCDAVRISGTDRGRRFRRHLAHGKPVVASEVGCCTYRGAAERGGPAWAIVDRVDRDRLAGTFVRDEELQAAEVMDLLRILDAEGAAGAFVFTFAAPALPHRADPARDLDMASYAVVRSYDDGHWEPKRLFHALAARNAAV